MPSPFLLLKPAFVLVSFPLLSGLLPRVLADKSSLVDADLVKAKAPNGIIRGATRDGKCYPSGDNVAAVLCPDSGLYQVSDSFTDCLIVPVHPDPQVQGALAFCGLKRTTDAFLVRTEAGPGPLLAGDEWALRTLTAAHGRKGGRAAEATRGARRPEPTAEDTERAMERADCESLKGVPLTQDQVGRLLVYARKALDAGAIASDGYEKCKTKAYNETRRIKKQLARNEMGESAAGGAEAGASRDDIDKAIQDLKPEKLFRVPLTLEQAERLVRNAQEANRNGAISKEVYQKCRTKGYHEMKRNKKQEAWKENEDAEDEVDNENWIEDGWKTINDGF